MKQGLGIRDWGLAGSPSAFSRRAHAARSGGNPSAICRLQSPRASLRTPHSVLRTRSSAFTLVELLVVISIIAILSAMSFEALQLAREAARERSTQATIAKLNNIILRRYESYVTRRVPIRIPPGTTPHDAAVIRLAALRDLMRMEMPERWNDVSDAPVLCRSSVVLRCKNPHYIFSTEQNMLRIHQTLILAMPNVYL